MPEYARTLNQEVKEELFWKSPFEVYYGRKPFRKDKISGVSTAQEWNIEGKVYEEMISARPKDYDSHELQVKRIRQAASRRCENRMIRKGLRNNPPSVYNIGEKVLIRYPPAKKRSSKRSILSAKILSSSKTLTKWISVNDITSTTMDKEKRKRKLACQSNKKMHKKNYLIPYSSHREKFTDMQSGINFSISYDPTKDGNCQFYALCHELANIGIFHSAETLREEIVSYLESHPNSPDGTSMELFAGTPWDQCLG